MLRRDAVEFVAAAIDDDAACPAFGAIMPPGLFERARRWQHLCYEAGFAGIDWPAEFGGRGLSADHARAWNEECARAGVAAYMNFQGIVLAGGAIRTFGTDEQQARYLDATLRADIVWCQLFSEPDAGSDLVGLSTRAEPTSDGWLVTGRKVWSSTAQLAQHAILLARTDPDEPGHRGISFFLFDMAANGVDVRPLRQMTGDSEFCEVFLDDAPMRADDLLGPLHEGGRLRRRYWPTSGHRSAPPGSDSGTGWRRSTSRTGHACVTGRSPCAAAARRSRSCSNAVGASRGSAR